MNRTEQIIKAFGLDVNPYSTQDEGQRYLLIIVQEIEGCERALTDAVAEVTSTAQRVLDRVTDPRGSINPLGVLQSQATILDALCAKLATLRSTLASAARTLGYTVTITAAKG